MTQMFILSMIIIIIIPMLILSMNLMLSKKKSLNQEKLTPFECGFDPLSYNRLPFSIQFFLISMIFLIFDIEITLLIPIIPLMFSFSIFTLILSSMFLFILITGLYFEYIEKSIEWKK